MYLGNISLSLFAERGTGGVCIIAGGRKRSGGPEDPCVYECFGPKQLIANLPCVLRLTEVRFYNNICATLHPLKRFCSLQELPVQLINCVLSESKGGNVHLWYLSVILV